MFESIIDSSELEIPCKFVLRTEFYFFLIDDNHVWEPLRKYQNSNRKILEGWHEKLKNILKSKITLKINNKEYQTERLYLSKIEQCSEYRLFACGQDIPLHKCVNVVMDRLVENKLIINESLQICSLSNLFDVCNFIESDKSDYFDPETLCYDFSYFFDIKY